MSPPLVVDIDGTLTRPGATGSPAPIDPRVFEPLYDWDGQIVLATGKAFPFPVALGQFIGIGRRVIAETGGIVCVDTTLEVLADGAAARAVAEEMTDRGYPPAAGDLNLINRWRETEVAFKRVAPLEELREVATARGLHVIDSGFAYHVKDPSVSKGRGLDRVAELIDLNLDEAVAVGDSINDTSVFERVGHAVAVQDADPDAKAAADLVIDGRAADGFLAVLEQVR